MATPLDTGLISYLIPLIIWIFVFVLSYALLEKTALLKGTQTVHAIIAFCIASVTLFIGNVSEVITFVIPWFIFMFIFLGLLFAGFMFFGLKEKEVWDQIGIWTIIAIGLFILVIALSYTYADVLTPYAGEAGEKTIQSETIRTIFHPRTLGGIFLLIIAALAAKFITDKSK